MRCEGLAIWAFEMRLVNPYPGTTFSYSGYFANRGWLYYASDDPTRSNPILGDLTEKFRLEAMRASIGQSQP